MPLGAAAEYQEPDPLPLSTEPLLGDHGRWHPNSAPPVPPSPGLPPPSWAALRVVTHFACSHELPYLGEWMTRCVLGHFVLFFNRYLPVA